MASQKSNGYYFGEESQTHSLASILNRHLIEARSENLKHVFAYYEGNDHRLEFVKSINEVDFVNDSHAVTANAVWYALESMTKPITWIMNINEFESVTEDLLTSIDDKVKRIVIQGVYHSEIIEFFAGLGKDIAFEGLRRVLMENAAVSAPSQFSRSEQPRLQPHFAASHGMEPSIHVEAPKKSLKRAWPEKGI